MPIIPSGLHNWLFNDVVSFLRQHFFIYDHTEGSHNYYKGYVDGKYRYCVVQRHPHKSISPKSLQHDIIPKSGIPEELWLKWAKAGNKKARKKVQHGGAKPCPED